MVARDEGPYVALDEDETQRVAAARAVLAELMLQEADAVGAQVGGPGVNAEAVDILRVVLATRAVHERNQAADRALQLLLRLAETQDGLNRLEESAQEVGRMLADLERVRAEGLTVPTTRAEIEPQRLELLHQQQALRDTELQLNRQLAELLTREAGDLRPIWPEIELTVYADPIDEQEAINTALATRADLAALRYARATVDGRTLPAIQQALGAANAGLGIVMGTRSGNRHRWNDTRDVEAVHRRWQLAALVADRERAVVHEVREAIAAVESSLLQIANSKQQVDARRDHRNALRQQQLVGAATPLQIRQARLDVLKAEQQLFSDVIAWKIAVVELKATQGLLATECGYLTPVTCYCADVCPE
jgi:hypothetical protein